MKSEFLLRSDPVKIRPQAFAVSQCSGRRFCGGLVLAVAVLNAAPVGGTVTSHLATSTMVAGPNAGADSVILAVNPAGAAWAATNNASWLHLNMTNGAGSTNVVFSFDANAGATRIGTLAIAGQTLTVTQAGSTYIAAPLGVTELVSSGLDQPCGVAVDGAGNVYIANNWPNEIKVWTAANNTLAKLPGLIESADGVAVDAADNIYIADDDFDSIDEVQNAFVDLTPKSEGPAAGNDTLPAVLPVTVNMLGFFAPTSDQPWQTICGLTNGVVSFAFDANTNSTNRTANICLLDNQSVPVTQSGAITPPTLVGAAMLSGGLFQFSFSNNNSSACFSVLCTTNLSLPLANWTVIGTATNTASGLFQFSVAATNCFQCFYCVCSR